MSKDKIKDIYDGEIISIWGDKEFVTLAIGLTTIAIPKEDWEDIKKDFLKIGEL